MRKQPTGEPVAGKPHTGFGGRGRREPFPTPIQRWRCPARSKRREAATCCCASVTSNQLNRSVTERPQDCIDARLIAGTLRLEPFEYILIHSQRNRCLGWQRLQALANKATNNVLYVSLRVFWHRFYVARARLQACPISFGFHRSRFATRAWLLSGTR